MKYLYIITILYLCNPAGLSSQESTVGIWKTIDDEENTAKSHIEIYEVNGRLHGKVVKLLEETARTTCEKCKGDKKDQPIVGMEIMWNMKKDGNKEEWKGGKIMDPKNGKEYKCKLKLNESDILEVRGFVGFSLLGRTQKWYRVKE